jgi:hypothetical protein
MTDLVGYANQLSKSVVKSMTKPVTVQRRREFIIKTREHLMDMRAALIHESASETRAMHRGQNGDAKDSADLASEESDRELAVMLAERGRGRTAEIDKCAQTHGRGRLRRVRSLSS